MVWKIEPGIGQTEAISLTAIREVGGKPSASAVKPGTAQPLCELNVAWRTLKGALNSPKRR
jgi:hypothetical protein